MSEDEQEADVIDLGGRWLTVTNRLAELAYDDDSPTPAFKNGDMVLMRWRTIDIDTEGSLSAKVTRLRMVRVVKFDKESQYWVVRTPESVCSVATEELRLPTEIETQAWERDGTLPKPWE